MREYSLKCCDGELFFDCTLIFEMVGNEAILRLHSAQFDLKASDSFPFLALAKLRLELEKKSVKLLCNGALRNVYPSGLFFQSLKAYKLYPGKQAGKEDLVFIFDATEEIEGVATVEEQKRFYLDYNKSRSTPDLI